MDRRAYFIKSAFFSIACSIIATLIVSLFKLFLVELGLDERSLATFGRIAFDTFYAHWGWYLIGITLVSFLGGIAGYIAPALRLANIASTAGLTDILQSEKLESDVPQVFKKGVRRKCEHNEDISILTTIGSPLFNDDNSLLRDTLSTVKRRINVFLLDPALNAQAARARAEAIDMDVIEFRQEIVNSIGYLKTLIDNNREIRVYLYDFMPQFGVIKSDEFLWVSYFPHALKGVESPVFGFEKIQPNSKPQGLYCFFSEYIFKLGQSYGGTSQPLNKSICLIEDLVNWRYPADLQPPKEKNIEPCKRVISAAGYQNLHEGLVEQRISCGSVESRLRQK